MTSVNHCYLISIPKLEKEENRLSKIVGVSRTFVVLVEQIMLFQYRVLANNSNITQHNA